MIFAVIDTNVIVAALRTKNHDSPTAKVMRAVFSGDVVPLFNGGIRAKIAPHRRIFR